jgi:hypothetical protein
MVGWPGGNDTFTLYHHPAEGFWAVLEPDREVGRYWCALGTEDPIPSRMVGLVCEINSPFEGANRRVAGLFARDSSGTVYLAHSGRVGGGRRGIGKEAFRAFFTDGEVREVQWPSGTVTETLVVGRLDDDRLPASIARFVRTVEQFKVIAVQGDDD